jgi:hypothetical protein
MGILKKDLETADLKNFPSGLPPETVKKLQEDYKTRLERYNDQTRRCNSTKPKAKGPKSTKN